MFSKRLANIFLVLAIFLAALGTTGSASAATPNGVDHLRGRWDGVVQGLQDQDQPFTLLLDKFGSDPNDPQAALYGGCIAIGAGASYTPVSARVQLVGTEQFDLTLFGTAATNYEAFIVKLTGLVKTFAAKVTDDLASGAWITANQGGEWSASHHDRRNPKCPAVQVNNNLFFHPDVYAGVNIDWDDSSHPGTILEGYSNIVSTGMKIQAPDGSILIAPFYTDLFSGSVDFINEFRFLSTPPGLPQTGAPYRFTLLDVFGQPIPGSTTTDIWTDCTMGPPQNVTTTVESDGLKVTWDPVAPAGGFDPGGSPQVGFFQIELSGLYGSSGIASDTHLIPFADFGGNAPGVPDGFDFGMGLAQFADGGTYTFEVISFSVPTVESGGVGLECQIRDVGEQTSFTKVGNVYTILPK